MGRHGVWGLVLLLASTKEVYGDPEVHPQRELSGLRKWRLAFAVVTKGRIAETLCFDYQRMHGVQVRVARLQY